MLLRNCIAANGLFAKYAIPMIIDKLESDVDSAKLDSLLTFVSERERESFKSLNS